jgi:hypothetical protein
MTTDVAETGREVDPPVEEAVGPEIGTGTEIETEIGTETETEIGAEIAETSEHALQEATRITTADRIVNELVRKGNSCVSVNDLAGVEMMLHQQLVEFERSDVNEACGIIAATTNK